MDITTIRAKAPSQRTKDEAELINKDNVKKANRVYQQNDKYKDYRKEYRRKKIFRKIVNYIDIYGPIENVLKFNILHTPAEYKKLFVELYGNDDYNLFVLN